MGLPQAKVAKAIYYSNKRKQLGQILVDLKIITPDELHYVLLQQTNLKHKRFYRPLGKLLAQKGIIGEEQYMEALSAHFCMPVVSLKDFRASPSLQKLVGERYAAENRIVVLNESPRELTVAIADPHLPVFETLEKGVPEGKYVRFCIARATEIAACLAAACEGPDLSEEGRTD